MTDLDRAVQTVVRRCLAVQRDEAVVVVTDEPLQGLGEKLRSAAQAAGADAVLTVMAPRAIDGSEPPAPVAEALAACDVFIAPASRSLSHTLARKRASEAGARGATMPHVTTDMLARLMSIDFDRLRRRSHAVPGLLRDAPPARRGPAQRRRRGTRPVPARERPPPRPGRPPRHRRRRRPHRPRVVRQPAVR